MKSLRRLFGLGLAVLTAVVYWSENAAFASAPAQSSSPTPRPIQSSTRTPTPQPFAATSTPRALSTTTTLTSPAPELTGTHLLPDLQTMPPTNLVIWIDAQGRKTLRFSNWILNAGQGALEIWGDSNEETEKTTVTQRIYRIDGSYEERKTGDFIFHPTHRHWHTENFALYELWSVAPGGATDKAVAVTDKVSYCLRDDQRSNLEGAAPRAAYWQCNQQMQGMSVGWIDIYSFDTPGQIVDITAVPDGIYALRSTVDPANQLVESNETNNAVMVYVELIGNRLRTLNRETLLTRLQTPAPTPTVVPTRTPATTPSVTSTTAP